MALGFFLALALILMIHGQDEPPGETFHYLIFEKCNSPAVASTGYED